MTEPLQPSTDEPLPGLGDPDAARTTPLERAVMRSLTHLADLGKVDARHAGLMELALQLARSMRPGEKAYGVAQCAAQLIAVFATLMPEEGGPTDGISELRAYLAGVEAGGGSPEVRNPS